ncbi:MAG TPA: quinohemoprotein amine dehydrogenase subunit alpha [Vicinamibacterales bacterium]|jgi:quinohemoprotein amine dehydrogenase
MLKRIFGIAAGLVLGTACLAQAQGQSPAAKSADAPDEGIPVQSDLVRTRCGGCHKSDDQKRMSRISYRRASPENWERTIKRMATLNHATLNPADARAILKYLSDHQGLAPEEDRPIAFEAERRLVEYTYAGDKDTSDTCSSCHTMARVLSERRTKDEWALLVAMHRGYYPLVDMQPMNNGQGFRRTRPIETEPGPDGRPPDNRAPMDKALEHLGKALPLMTPEWSAWSAAMQSPKLAGQWALTGSMLGKGPIFGRVTIAVDSSAPDSFTTEVQYTVARTGESVSRTSKGLVYTGYQWRGRGAGAGSEMPWREVMFVERGWNEMWGRWFTGAYDETGIDVTLTRQTGAPIVTGTSAAALRTGASNQALKIFGMNLPASPRAEDIGIGQGVKVSRVVSATPTEIALELDVAPSAPIGVRDVSIAGAVKPAALVVYDKIDAIRVLPQAGLARVGGAVFPKQLQQFEAVGIHNGPDGKPDTADDLVLGIVDVKWSVEEYTATFSDDDAQFVGAIDASGLFTPALDGPNPKRSGNRNNVGDVWVVAELASPATARDPSKPVRGRAQLLVTVPLYMNWFESEPSK